MKTSDIIATARRQYLYDINEPYLWPDVFLLHALMEAQKEAARRAFLIRETSLATAADIANGSSTSTVVGQLVDAAATFTNAVVGLAVYNLTKNTWAVISSFTDQHTLVLSSDIMVQGDSYIIGTPAQALTRVCVQTGTSVYSLSDSIVKIDTIRLASQYHPLVKKSEGWLDNHYFNWRSATSRPRYFIERRGSVQIVPTPDASLNNGAGVDTGIL